MKVLVANRGEIAVRILRACRELGFPSVAVYSEADQGALHTRYAEEAVFIGPAPASESYLNIAAVLAAARQSGADAIHPGYGFLAENAEFAGEVEKNGMTFIGPRPETISLTGDKLAARRIARESGLPVLSGPDVPITEGEFSARMVRQMEFPLLVKAVAGGGGRGIRLARTSQELEQMVVAARREAQASFGYDQVYLEPLVQDARHIEVQIIGDGRGKVLILGERECSIQRRRQKLIEEAPAPGLSRRLRRRIHESALKLAQKLNYRSLGTVEFLLDKKGCYYFIEVNPRIQVEHPVSELVTGVDLVAEQLRLADGAELGYTQDQIEVNGWAIEARVLAEDPEQGFLPATGQITYLKEPNGPGIRVDSALYPGMMVTADYDSMMAKVIAYGEDRNNAIRRLRRALGEFRIGGVPTDIEFLFQIVNSDKFIAGDVNTSYLESFHPPKQEGKEGLEVEVALAVAMLAHQVFEKAKSSFNPPASNWRMAGWREQMRGVI